MTSPDTKPRIKLFAILSAVFIVLNVTSVGLVGLISYLHGQQAIADVADRLTMETHQRIQEQLRRFLEIPRHINQINAELLTHGHLSADQPKALERHFWHQIGRHQGLSSIYFGNSAGGLSDAGQNPGDGSRYILTTADMAAGPLHKYATDDEGQRTEQLLHIPQFDARARPWYRRAVTRGAEVWSTPYVLSTGQDMAIAVSQPVYAPEGELLGVTSVDIFLSDFSRFLRELDLPGQGEAFLLDHNGFLIASSSKTQPLIERSPEGTPRQVHAQDSSSRVVRTTAEILQQQLDAPLQEFRPARLQIANKTHYLQLAPLRDTVDVSWHVAVAIPEQAFMGQIRSSNQLTLMWVPAAGLITLLAGLWCARRITRPIEVLSRLAEDFSRGKPAPVQMVHSRISEFARLSRSFSDMTTQVQDKITALTKEVELRKQLTANLEQSEEKYRTVIDHQQDALLLHQIVADGYAPFSEVNARACEFYGYPKEELLKMRISDLIAPDMLQHHQARDDRRRVLDQGGLLVTSVHLNRSGERIPVEVSVSVVELNQERYLLSSVRDISARKKAEEALSLSNEILQKLATTANDAIIQIDDQGRTIFWNQAASSIFGYSVSEVMGRKVHDLLAPNEALKRFEAAFPTFVAEGRGPAIGQTVELEACHKNGERVSVELSLSAFQYRQKWHAMAIIRDISERKKADAERRRLEEELRQKYKMEAVGVMAGGIAHNFNNNLAIILGNIELAQLNPTRPEKLHEMLSNAKIAVLRSRDLIQQILMYSRQGIQSKRAIQLAVVIDETLKLLRSTLPTTVTLDNRLAESHQEISIHADSGRIQEALINLCTNAVQAMDESGTLTIALDSVMLKAEQLPVQFDCPPGRYARLHVSDTGSGIEESHLNRIFDPFFTTKGVEQGTGMGLATVQGIVKNHQGAIKVTSQPGSGTTFSLYFPQIATAESSQSEETPLPLPSGSGHILFVDDDPMLTELGRRMLEGAGYHVTGATDSRRVVEDFRSSPESFDLLITDQTMPGLTGKDLIAELRRIRPGLPAILCTGFSNKISEDEARALGINAFCLKPLELHELLDAVREALR